MLRDGSILSLCIPIVDRENRTLRGCIMGWTGIYGQAPFGSKEDKQAFIQAHALGKNLQIIDFSAKGNVCYAAVEHKESSEVFGMVVLLSYRNNERLFKEMDESEGPFYYDCPKRIIQKLSPTRHESALKWRATCLSGAEDSKDEGWIVMARISGQRRRKPLILRDSRIYGASNKKQATRFAQKKEAENAAKEYQFDADRYWATLEVVGL